MRRVFIPLPHQLSAEDSWYGVKVRGDQNADGTWKPCIEFQSRRVRVEACPNLTLLTVDELKEWARHLDAPFLMNALNEASKGRILRVRNRRRTDL